MGFYGAKSRVKISFPSKQYCSVDAIPKEVWYKLHGTLTPSEKDGLTKG